METILTTKLHIPAIHPNRIPRSHLIQKLDEDLWQIRGQRFLRRLTLIAAPAGYGKSTLACEWVGHQEILVAWISLDESDNDPGRFLQYLVAAIGTVQPGFGQSFAALLRSAQDPVTGEMAVSMMAALVNEAAAIPQPFLIVFDDYHTIQNQAIHQAVKLLLEHLPENLSLVIATRSDPPLGLSRLRARRQMVEVRAGQLRFSESEADRFLRQVMLLELQERDILTLTETTEGWIAGLQMAALALQGRSDTAGFIRHFSGRERFVIDYLFEEVLSRLPEPIQTFLMQTAILERMTGPLCDAVLGNQPELASTLPSGQLTLEYLDRANLFLVPLDHEFCYYRYHHLFADLLRHRLNASFPALVPQLHARAAEWFEQQGLAAQAFDHWIAARNDQKAAGVIVAYGYRAFEQGNLQQLLNWLQQVPAELVHSQPWLCFFYGLAYTFTGRYSEAEIYLAAGEKTLLPVLDTADPVTLEPYGHIAAVREYLASRRQDAEGVKYYAELAMKYIAADNRYMRSVVSFFLAVSWYKSNDYDQAYACLLECAPLAKEARNWVIAVSALCSLGELSRIRGKLHDGLTFYDEAARLAVDAQGRPLPVTAEAYVGRARLFGEWHDDAAMAADLREAEKLFPLYLNFDLKVEYNIHSARLAFAQGSAAAGEQLIHEIEQSDQKAFYKSAAAFLACRIDFYLANGDLKTVRQITGAHDWNVETQNLFAWAEAFIAYARFLAAQQAFDQAYQLLDACRARLETYGLWTYALKAQVAQACVLDLQGQPAAALEQMQRALSLAEPEGFIRIFIDLGEPAPSLLTRCRAALAQGPSGSDAARCRLAYIDRLLSAFPGQPAEKTEKVDNIPAKAAPCPDLVDPLTDREMEVLQLMAAGLSNNEIAEKLVVSVGTVKSHTSNIYRKLDVLSRAKAVAKACELNLLTSIWN